MLGFDARFGGTTQGGIDNLLIIIPEPSRVLLMLSGLLGITLRRRRQATHELDERSLLLADGLR